MFSACLWSAFLGRAPLCCPLWISCWLDRLLLWQSAAVPAECAGPALKSYNSRRSGRTTDFKNTKRTEEVSSIIVVSLSIFSLSVFCLSSPMQAYLRLKSHLLFDAHAHSLLSFAELFFSIRMPNIWCIQSGPNAHMVLVLFVHFLKKVLKTMQIPCNLEESK